MSSKENVSRIGEASTSTKTGERDVYRFTKQELIEELRKSVNVRTFLESLSIDVLRKKLSRASEKTARFGRRERNSSPKQP